MLIVTDLHCTDRERDEYRWELFPWLAAQAEETESEEILVLGDLTDSKDGHSAALVNRIIENLLSLPAKVYVLKGNHDYIDEGKPFFNFMNFHNLRFISEPTILELEVGDVLMLPHTRAPSEEWAELELLTIDPQYSLICCHQTFDGADAGGGFRLQGGISSNFFSKTLEIDTPVIAGDIHVPQTIGDVTYVGTPYPVNFGDSHEPRALEVFEMMGGKLEMSSIAVPSIKKVSATITHMHELHDLGLRPGDQLKLKVRLPRTDFHLWDKIKADTSELLRVQGVLLHSISLETIEARRDQPSFSKKKMNKAKSISSDPQGTLKAFCAHRGFSEGSEWAGEDILGETK